jgi:hypothetical protein
MYWKLICTINWFISCCRLVAQGSKCPGNPKIARDEEVRPPDLGEILHAIIRELGIPQTLKAVSVGRDRLDAQVVNSLHDIWIKTNAVPMTENRKLWKSWKWLRDNILLALSLYLLETFTTFKHL